jgi:hypothetical protein
LPFQATNEPLELIFHDIHEHGVEIHNLWMQEVVQRTHGAVRFTITRGIDRSAIEKADIVRDIPARGGVYRLLDLIQTPLILSGSTAGSKVVSQLYAEFPEMRQELSDYKVVGLGTGALMAIFSSKAWGPLRTAEKLKGARIRSLLPIDRALEAFGSQPVHLLYHEVCQNVMDRKVDAIILGLLPGKMFQIADAGAPFCNVALPLSITMHPVRFYIKWASWHKLPPEVQHVIDSLGPEGSDCWFADQCGRDFDNHLPAALDYVRQKGEIVPITGTELEKWRQILQPAREMAVNALDDLGLPGQRFFKRMLELAAQYS